MNSSPKIKILKQLARTTGEIAETALQKEAAKIATELENETRFDLLEQQIEMLDTFAFRVPETAVQIVRQFLDHLDALELTHQDELDWPKAELTKFENKNHLIVEVLKLLDRIRYHRLEDILEIFLSHSRHEDADVKTQAGQGLEHLAEYNIDIFYAGDNRAGFGPAPQIEVLECLEGLDTPEQRRNFSAITEVCNHLLSPSMTSTTSDYKSFTWSSSPVPGTDQIKDIRRRSLQLLKELYCVATTTTEKMSVINAMQGSTRTPNMGDYGDDVLDMVSRDTHEILAFFKEILPEENLQIVQKIEHDAFWRYRYAPSNDVKASALEIRDILATHDEYTIYKDLIGFEGVFEDWEKSLTNETDFQRTDEYRSAKATEYAQSINSENWAKWRCRILRFATTESDDLATFPNFFNFLRQFAEKSPDLAFGLLTENLDEIRLFTIPLLRGLWKGSRNPDLRALMLEWIAADQQLVAVAKLFVSNDNIDEELLRTLLEKGIEDANRDILISIVAVAASNYDDGLKDLVPNFFLPAVEALTKIEDTGWIHELWYRKELSDVLHSLGERGREIVLNGLLVLGDIDYHAEELLIPLATDNPERIIAFFGERLRYKEEVKLERRYDEIPFKFYRLHETLSNFPEIAVNTVRSWFDGKEALFQYRGANLLKIIFPDLAEPFAAKLLELVRTSERQNIKFVLCVLRNYQGEPFTHGICREIVAILPKNDELLKNVSMVLRSTGVVTGEFGFAEAYEGKMLEIKPWLNDENEDVRDFAANYITLLEDLAKAERSRAEEEIELRKHAYGIREEEADEEYGADGQHESANERGGKED